MVELARNVPFAAGLSGAGLAVDAQASSRRFLLSGDADAVSRALCAEVPRAPKTLLKLAGIGRCLWLRPDQWLLLCAPDDQAPGAEGPAWVLDVSSRYAGVHLRGPRVVDVLAAGCGLDFREQAFAVGHCAQSRIDLVPAILLRVAQDEFEVMVERPLAQYFEKWLQACLSPRERSPRSGG